MAFVARLEGWSIDGSKVGTPFRGGEAGIVQVHLYLFSDALVFAASSVWHGSRPSKKLRGLDDIAPDALRPTDITDRDAKALTITVDQIVEVKFRKHRFLGRAGRGGMFAAVFVLADGVPPVAAHILGTTLDANMAALDPIIGDRLDLED